MDAVKQAGITNISIVTQPLREVSTRRHEPLISISAATTYSPQRQARRQLRRLARPARCRRRSHLRLGARSSTHGLRAGAKTPPPPEPSRPPWSHRFPCRPSSATSTPASLPPRRPAPPLSPPRKRPSRHPTPNEVAIPEKTTKPIKTAEKPTPAPPKHLQPVRRAAYQGRHRRDRWHPHRRRPRMELKNGTASIDRRRTAPSARASPTTSTSSTARSRRTGTPRRPILAPPSARASPSSSTSTATASLQRPHRNPQRLPFARPLRHARRATRRQASARFPQGDHITVEYTFHYHRK